VPLEKARRDSHNRNFISAKISQESKPGGRGSKVEPCLAYECGTNPEGQSIRRIVLTDLSCSCVGKTPASRCALTGSVESKIYWRKYD